MNNKLIKMAALAATMFIGFSSNANNCYECLQESGQYSFRCENSSIGSYGGETDTPEDERQLCQANGGFFTLAPL